MLHKWCDLFTSVAFKHKSGVIVNNLKHKRREIMSRKILFCQRITLSAFILLNKAEIEG